MRVLGFMTGTSLDAVDMAVIETDGEAILGLGPAGEEKQSIPVSGRWSRRPRPRPFAGPLARPSRTSSPPPPLRSRPSTWQPATGSWRATGSYRRTLT